MPIAKVFSNRDGIRSGWWQDPATGRNVIVNKQDCSDILRHTAHSRNHGQAKNVFGDPLIGSVPVVEYYDALARHGIDARTWFRMPMREKRKWHRKMFRGEWSAFRATPKGF